jgi:hypothetical protein
MGKCSPTSRGRTEQIHTNVPILVLSSLTGYRWQWKLLCGCGKVFAREVRPAVMSLPTIHRDVQSTPSPRRLLKAGDRVHPHTRGGRLQTCVMSALIYVWILQRIPPQAPPRTISSTATSKSLTCFPARPRIRVLYC